MLLVRMKFTYLSINSWFKTYVQSSMTIRFKTHWSLHVSKAMRGVYIFVAELYIIKYGAKIFANFSGKVDWDIWSEIYIFSGFNCCNVFDCFG